MKHHTYQTPWRQHSIQIRCWTMPKQNLVSALMHENCCRSEAKPPKAGLEVLNPRVWDNLRGFVGYIYIYIFVGVSNHGLSSFRFETPMLVCWFPLEQSIWVCMNIGRHQKKGNFDGTIIITDDILGYWRLFSDNIWNWAWKRFYIIKIIVCFHAANQIMLSIDSCSSAVFVLYP